LSTALHTGKGSDVDPGRLGTALRQRIAWLTDARRNLSGVATEAPVLVVVLGREHYLERRRRYPIHSQRDLDAVLKQELAHAAPTLTMVGEPEQDKREVAFYELRPGVLEKVGRAVWLVPESAILSKTLPKGRVASVDRDGFRYFLASTGASQPAGGTVASAELFALATGLDGTEGPITLDREQAAQRISAGLRALSPRDWLRLRRPAASSQARVDWRAVGTVAGIGLVAYLALASGYLLLTTESRETKLGTLGPEVESLLDAQREVDALAAQREGVQKVLAGQADTHELWRIVGIAWSKGANLNAVELLDFELTLRGSARSATEVLAALDVAPGVDSARFSAPVRGAKSGGEEFAITLTMSRKATGG